MVKKISKFPFLFLSGIVILCFCYPSVPQKSDLNATISVADTAWMLMATALVLRASLKTA